MFQEGLDSLKFELMKLSLMYDQLPKHLQRWVDSNSPVGFKQMLQQQKDLIKMRVVPANQEETEFKW